MTAALPARCWRPRSAAGPSPTGRDGAPGTGPFRTACPATASPVPVSATAASPTAVSPVAASPTAVPSRAAAPVVGAAPAGPGPLSAVATAAETSGVGNAPERGIPARATCSSTAARRLAERRGSGGANGTRSSNGTLSSAGDAQASRAGGHPVSPWGDLLAARPGCRPALVRTEVPGTVPVRAGAVGPDRHHPPSGPPATDATRRQGTSSTLPVVARPSRASWAAAASSSGNSAPMRTDMPSATAANRSAARQSISARSWM